MDRLEAMGIFLRVIDRGGFSAASRELAVPLATVSRKVSELESHLGTKLLRRTTRKVALTDAGVAYAAAVRRILESLDEAERVAAGEFREPRGELVLTAPVLFGRLHVLPVLADFLNAYPQISVRLLLTDRNLHLIDDRVDVAARIGVLPDSSMAATSIGTLRTVLCASPDLIARHGEPADPAALLSWPWVVFDALAPALPIKPRLFVTTAEAAVAAAARSVGVTRVLHYQCADAVRDGALRILLSDFEPEPVPVHLLHAARAALPSKVRVFLDFAAGRLRAQLQRACPVAAPRRP